LKKKTQLAFNKANKFKEKHAAARAAMLADENRGCCGQWQPARRSRSPRGHARLTKDILV